MQNRLTVKKYTLSLYTVLFSKTYKKNYLTMTKEFPGGCIIKVKNNSPDVKINKRDLINVIPKSLYFRDCLGLIVDPSILILNPSGTYDLHTPNTHLASFIGKVTGEDIKINYKTVISKLLGEFPKEIGDIETIDSKKIKAQNCVVKAKYQSPEYFSRRLYLLPEQQYEYRYFIFLALDTIKSEPYEYISKIEDDIEKLISTDIYYDRQKNSCVHPILFIFAEVAKELYESSVPQAAAIEVIKKLLTDFKHAYGKFIKIADQIGLDSTPYKDLSGLEEIFDPDNVASAFENITNITDKKLR